MPKITTSEEARELSKNTQFKKGESGNPNGRPLHPISAILRELGEATSLKYSLTITDSKGSVEVKAFEFNSNDDKSINEVIALELLRKALNGSLPCIKEVLDRQEGRTKQEIDLISEVHQDLDLSKVSDEALNELADTLLQLEQKT